MARTVTVTAATDADRELFGRLMQLYLHDFSEYDGRRPALDGRFEYRWFDAYWTDRDRRAYLFRVGDHPAGFALVRLTDPIEMAEFFVVRAYRRSGVGRSAARRVLSLHVGPWRVTEVAANSPAVEFWRSAIPAEFTERRHSDGSWEQRFTIAPTRPPERVGRRFGDAPPAHRRAG